MSAEITPAMHDLAVCTTCNTFQKLLAKLSAYQKLIDKVGYGKLRGKTEIKISQYRGDFFTHLDTHFDRLDEEEKQKDGSKT